MQRESFLVVAQLTLSCKMTSFKDCVADESKSSPANQNQDMQSICYWNCQRSSLAFLHCLATCPCSRQHNAQYSVRVMMSSIKVMAGHAPAFVKFIALNALWPACAACLRVRPVIVVHVCLSVCKDSLPPSNTQHPTPPPHPQCWACDKWDSECRRQCDCW